MSVMVHFYLGVFARRERTSLINIVVDPGRAPYCNSAGEMSAILWDTETRIVWVHCNVCKRNALSPGERSQVEKCLP